MGDHTIAAPCTKAVARAFSAYMQAVRDGWETESFADALALEESRREDNWAPRWSYRQCGFYHRQLVPYFERFPRSQIRIYFFDELIDGPVQIAQEIYAFLGVDENFEPETKARYNVSGVSRNKSIQALLSKPNPLLRGAVRAVLPTHLRQRTTSRLKQLNLQKIIGAMKSGTTSAYQYLRQHPAIYMPQNKEPKFFAWDGSEGPAFIGPGDEQGVDSTIFQLEAYQALFADVTSETAIGEASTAYLFFADNTAERIWRRIPEAKLIAFLRHPVERAYSAYMHLVRDGRETAGDFAAGLSLEAQRRRDNWAPL